MEMVVEECEVKMVGEECEVKMVDEEWPVVGNVGCSVECDMKCTMVTSGGDIY